MTAPKAEPRGASSRSRRRWIGALAVTAFLVAANWAPVAWGSMFGEENVTLVKLLAETMQIEDDMHQLDEAASTTANVLGDLRDTYARANAGIDELQSYSFDHFLDDFQKDLYSTYPGIGKLAGASKNLRHWEDTHSSSPWTAYDAITAVAGDATAGLRRDVADGKTNIDHELILKREAAGSFALASQSEDATRKFDEDTAALARFAEDASPGKSEQLSAKALVLVAAQNSYIIRLLSRSVRLDGVDKTLEYGSRIEARNAGYDPRYDGAGLVDDALEPEPMVTVTPIWEGW